MGRIFTYVLGFFLVVTTETYSATITAVSNGNWTTNSTWSCGCQPSSSDNIVIPAGITVTANGPVILFLGPVIKITISGTLVLNNASLQVDGTDTVDIKSGGQIKATGITGGQVYSGVIPIFIANGSSINGPSKITAGSLPVTLLFFEGKVQGNNVLLQWASASEINSDCYRVTRSVDGIHFETISKIQAAGKSTRQLDYLFTDGEPLLGTSYYRLQSVDLNGPVTDFSIIRVVVDKARTVEVFPNPSTGEELTAKLNFYPEEGSQLSVYDSRGTVVLMKQLSPTEHTVDFDLSTTVEHGLYYVVVSTKSERLKRMIMVQ
jgi:Secretion system C-terminal sorting domain